MMNKSSIRSFAFGIFFSAIIILIGYLIINNQEEAAVTKKEVEQYLAREKLVAIKKDRYNTLLLLEENNNKATNKKRNESGKTKAEHNIQTKINTNETGVSFTISKGMTSIDIAQELESLQVIHSADDFNSFLQKSGLNRLLQIGNYQLEKNMKYNRLAKILTKQE